MCQQACEKDGEAPPCRDGRNVPEFQGSRVPEFEEEEETDDANREIGVPRGCDYAPPELWAGNALAWEIYDRVRFCRKGDWQNGLDYGVLFRVMELKEAKRE